jgi:hypothetical protein
VPATFFEAGEHVVQYPQETRMLAEAGYPVEDHTWSHLDLTTIQSHRRPYMSLAGMPLAKIEAAIGVSRTAARKIRSGQLVPHVRHWEVLAELSATTTDFAMWFLLGSGMGVHSPSPRRGRCRRQLFPGRTCRFCRRAELS